MAFRAGADASERLHEFTTWLRSEGALFPKIVFHDFGPERGLGAMATEDIEPDEMLFTVPLPIVINDAVVQRSPLACRVKELMESGQCGKADDRFLLYLFILGERNNPQSSWRPYFRTLPGDIHSTPLTFSDVEVEELRGCNVYVSQVGLRRTLKQMYDAVVPALTKLDSNFFPPHLFTWNDLIWAYSVFWTRCYGLTLGGETVASLVPLADILNHSPMTKVTYFTHEPNGTFQIQCHDGVRAGEEVVSNYGDAKGNEKLILTYGFAVLDNPEDEYYVELGATVISDAKKELMERKNISLGHYMRRNYLPPDLLRCVRVCLMTNEEMYFLHPNDTIDFISHANEMRALSMLAGLLRANLSRFETSVQEDRSLLTNGGLTPNMRAVIIYRLGQKEILHQALSALTAMAGQYPGHGVPVINPSQDDVEKFRAWVVGNGGSCRIGWTRQGAVLEDDVAENESILSIPINMMITPAVAMASSLGAVFSQIQGLDEDLIMLLFLVHTAADPASPWAPFFSIMSTASSPLTSSPEELALLGNMQLAGDVEETLAHLAEDYGDVVGMLCKQLPHVFDPSVYTWEAYVRAFCIGEMCSSSVKIEGSVVNAVVPLPPLPFHPSGPVFAWTSEGTSSWNICSFPALSAGSPVSRGADASSNCQLAMALGIVSDANDDDVVSLAVRPPGDGAAERAMLLKQWGLGLDEHFLRSSSLPGPLLASLRVSLLGDHEVAAFLEAETSPYEMISKDNEKEVLSVARSMLFSVKEAVVEHSPDEDLALLHSDLSRTARLAVTYRSGQAKIILASLDMLERAKMAL